MEFKTVYLLFTFLVGGEEMEVKIPAKDLPTCEQQSQYIEANRKQFPFEVVSTECVLWI
jgi:hypothetical protein